METRRKGTCETCVHAMPYLQECVPGFVFLECELTGEQVKCGPYTCQRWELSPKADFDFSHGPRELVGNG